MEGRNNNQAFSKVLIRLCVDYWDEKLPDYNFSLRVDQQIYLLVGDFEFLVATNANNLEKKIPLSYLLDVSIKISTNIGLNLHDIFHPIITNHVWNQNCISQDNTLKKEQLPKAGVEFFF